jgi:hypothetical protein
LKASKDINGDVIVTGGASGQIDKTDARKRSLLSMWKGEKEGDMKSEGLATFYRRDLA